MIIELHGAGFSNKGAEMMLRTTIAELGQRIPGVRFAIDPSYGSYPQRSQLGLYQLFPLRTHVGTPGFYFRLWRQKIVNIILCDKIFKRVFGVFPDTLGVVKLSEIDALVDISGFAYSDQWGSKPTQDLARLVKQYTDKRKPAILLPQAYGPFSDAKSRDAFRFVLNKASLVYARDRKSFSYARQLSAQNNLRLAPDITFFYPNTKFQNTPNKLSEYICVVPNIRMLDQGMEDWEGKYLQLLLDGISEISEYGLKVQILVHDSTGFDEEIASVLLEKADNRSVTLINEKNPLKLKQIIGRSRFIVSSRYHSLIAAFSRSVPAIGLGWSHKYEMLFKDFHCNELFISSHASTDEFFKALILLSNPKTNQQYRVKISKQLQELNDTNRNMWVDVANVLKQANEQQFA